MHKSPIVITREGAYQGLHDDQNHVNRYLGIPYAAPPVGPLRFHKPQPYCGHGGVRQATEFGPIAWQWADRDEQSLPRTRQPMSEDCLYLNIYAPEKAENCPVLFWIHGGASIWGCGSDPIYDGTRLAQQGIIVVTFNHRLGALGFLCHPELTSSQGGLSGNYGVWDMIAAFNWVYDNIASFGGDPARITMGGQSAGAGATEYLMTCPQLKDRIHGAFLCSTAPYSYSKIPLSLAHYEQSGAAYMAEMGLNTLEDLMTAPVRLWADRRDKMLCGGFSFVRDHVIFSQELRMAFENETICRIPTVIGAAYEERRCLREPDIPDPLSELRRRVEGRGMAWEDFCRVCPAALTEPWTVMNALGGEFDFAAVCHSARRMRRSQKDVYAFRFCRDVPSHDPTRYGAGHSDDLPYWFDALEAVSLPWTAEDRLLAKTMSSQLAAFVRTGSPNAEGLPRWEPYDDCAMYLGHRQAHASLCTPLENRAMTDYLMRFSSFADIL